MTRSRIATDIYGAPCHCPECTRAGATHLRLVKVPPDAYCSQWHWLHGEDLRDWYRARDKFMNEARAQLGLPPTRRR